MTELPSELVCRHLRFGTQGAEPAPDPAEFWRLLESLPSADLMTFAGNYPSWDMETPKMPRRCAAVMKNACLGYSVGDNFFVSVRIDISFDFKLLSFL